MICLPQSHARVILGRGSIRGKIRASMSKRIEVRILLPSLPAGDLGKSFILLCLSPSQVKKGLLILQMVTVENK